MSFDYGWRKAKKIKKKKYHAFKGYGFGSTKKDVKKLYKLKKIW